MSDSVHSHIEVVSDEDENNFIYDNQTNIDENINEFSKKYLDKLENKRKKN